LKLVSDGFSNEDETTLFANHNLAYAVSIASGDKEDVQVWIARGDEPVPRRIVITYRQIEGQPQFWAQFTDWNFSPELSDTTFTFSPPDPQSLVSWPCRTVVVAVQKLLRQITGKRNFFWLLAALLVFLLGVPFAGEFGNYGFHPGQV
jgi:hypothetical protein